MVVESGIPPRDQPRGGGMESVHMDSPVHMVPLRRKYHESQQPSLGDILMKILGSSGKCPNSRQSLWDCITASYAKMRTL